MKELFYGSVLMDFPRKCFLGGISFWTLFVHMPLDMSFSFWSRYSPPDLLKTVNLKYEIDLSSLIIIQQLEFRYKYYIWVMWVKFSGVILSYSPWVHILGLVLSSWPILQAVHVGLGAVKQQLVEEVSTEMGLVWCTWFSLDADNMWKESRKSCMPHELQTMSISYELARGKTRPSRGWDGVTGNLKHQQEPRWSGQQEVMTELFESIDHSSPILEEQTPS